MRKIFSIFLIEIDLCVQQKLDKKEAKYNIVVTVLK